MDSASIASSTRSTFAAEPLIDRRSAGRPRLEAAPRAEAGGAQPIAAWRLALLPIVGLAAADTVIDLPQLRSATWVLAVLVAGAAALLAAAAAETMPAALLHDS